MSGVVFTPAAADRIGRATRWVEAQRQAGREPAGPGRGVEPVWARVTSGTADGDGYYPGVITLRAGDDGSWSDYSAVKVGPLNGETLTNAARYAVRPSGRTSAGDELYTVIGATVAAGAIAVEAADGTPAYASVTKVTFDEADGFLVSQPVAGVAQVDMRAASNNYPGVVTTGFQEFAGIKYCLRGLRVSPPAVDSEDPQGLAGGDPAGIINCNIVLTSTTGGGGPTLSNWAGTIGYSSSAGGLRIAGGSNTYDYGTELLVTYGRLYLRKTLLADNSSLEPAVYVYSADAADYVLAYTGPAAVDGTYYVCGLRTSAGTGIIDGGTW